MYRYLSRSLNNDNRDVAGGRNSNKNKGTILVDLARIFGSSESNFTHESLCDDCCGSIFLLTSCFSRCTLICVYFRCHSTSPDSSSNDDCFAISSTTLFNLFSNHIELGGFVGD